MDLGPCDDGDNCTADSCVAGQCVHADKTGTDAVTCRLAALDADLSAAGPTKLGGAARAAALRARIGKAQSLVERSRSLNGKKSLKKLRGANKQMGVFVKLVKRGQSRSKIAAPLAEQLLTLASDTASRLQQLIPP